MTGGSGMIGRKVMELLDGGSVRNVSLPIHNLDDFRQCKVLMTGVDYLFHIAGVKGSGKMTKERPADFFVPMLQMNTNIFEAARIKDVHKILYLSSTAVTHDKFPGWAKETGEKQLEAYQQQYGFDNWVIIRLNAAYGEGDNFDPNDGMFIPSLMAKIKRGDNPVVVKGDGSDIRDFIYSGDVAEILVRAMDRIVGLWELGGVFHHSISEVVDTMRKIVDFNVEYSEGGGTRRTVNSRPLYRAVDYTPQTSLIQGLEKTWKSCLQH